MKDSNAGLKEFSNSFFRITQNTFPMLRYLIQVEQDCSGLKLLSTTFYTILITLV